MVRITHVPLHSKILITFVKVCKLFRSHRTMSVVVGIVKLPTYHRSNTQMVHIWSKWLCSGSHNIPTHNDFNLHCIHVGHMYLHMLTPHWYTSTDVVRDDNSQNSNV